jgi:hypothetical protein
MILRPWLKLQSNKIQIVQAPEPDDGLLRRKFDRIMLDRIDNKNYFLHRVIFGDESTFHVCGMVNKHNCRIWGSESPHAVRKYERDSPKLNVWCTFPRHEVSGPFFFQGKTIHITNYRDMLELLAVPQMAHLGANVFFQQDGAAPHWGLTVRQTMNKTFPNIEWAGRTNPLAPSLPRYNRIGWFL